MGSSGSRMKVDWDSDFVSIDVNDSDDIEASNNRSRNNSTTGVRGMAPYGYGYPAAAPLVHGESSVRAERNQRRRDMNYSSLDEVIEALRNAGLESSNLIVGIDFTKSNEWTGKASFNNRRLHAIGDTPNPYENTISIIGKTLAPFDEDNLIPCFGFGDATTHDQEVFSFRNDHSPCHGFEEVLSCYKKIVPNLQLSGPTSYAPVVDAAIDIVHESGGQHHVLLIISDGEVTRSVNTSDNEPSLQEKQTIESIVDARRVTGRAKKIIPRPPPVLPTCETSSPLVCPICLINEKDLAFGCGHVICRDCGSRLSNCPLCREYITNRLKVFIN